MWPMLLTAKVSSSKKVKNSEKHSNNSSVNVPLVADHGELAQHKTITYPPSAQDTVSFFHTCLNGLNAISGVGILSVPYALASGGWLSLLLLFGIATAALYTGTLIKRCMDMNTNIRSYPDIGELAFEKTGRIIVSVSMYTELYLVSIGFLILEGDNLSNLFPNAKVQIAGLAIAGMLVHWNGLPTAVSLYAFCYCAHPLFPTLYNSMTNKHRFTNVLIGCFLLTTVGYASMATVGYLMFGEEVESQVTLNLPLNKISSKVTIYTTLMNPISKFALMATPITNALKDLLPRRYRNRVTSILVSTLLVMSTTIAALVLPFFGSLMSLVGAFLSVTASILLPCLCYFKISDTYRNFGCESVVIVILIMAALAMAISGTYTSFMEIAHHLVQL
ncbi:amino acid transporter AVT1J isoform X1 [Vigna radiata var. radiata]|uniref:Amino acid transporter AVT1J isoform X1 n=1 Tax=Vigna radiata var. radiata TaxID=3916 RepID=A0A3Q0EZC6_VIGRR|nr:amino acid transporter AVT1J isoform X1 [Vigna radiata var. radiata]